MMARSHVKRAFSGVVAVLLMPAMVSVGVRSKSRSSDETMSKVAIKKYPGADITETRADQILVDASSVLVAVDATDDFKCPLILQRSGPLATASTGGVVNIKSDFDKLCADTSTYVHVVRAINWCGAISPNVIGCANTPGRCMAVVRYLNSPDRQEEGILWAHEYGHSRGLFHRDDDGAIMHSAIAPEHRCVNASERDAFLSQAQPASSQAPTAMPSPQPLEQAVRRTYIHGVPYDVATQLPAGSTPQLLGMLENRDDLPYWSNIATILGMLGDKRAERPLIDFVRRGSGELAPAEYRAKTSGVIALGYLTNQIGDGEALDFLIRLLDRARGIDAEIAWRRASSESQAETDLDLSQSAALALALSGQPRAEAALRGSQQTYRTAAAPQALKSAMDDLIGQAIQEHQRVRAVGLATYDRAKQSAGSGGRQ